MKVSERNLAILSVVAFALYVAVLVVTTASPCRIFGGGGWFEPPCDIRIGIVEADLVYNGIDPYDIWSGKRIIKGYRPGLYSPGADYSNYSDSDEDVNVHPPWFYAAMLPFVFLPIRIATAIHFLLMAAGLITLVILGYRLSRKYGLDACESIVAATSSVLVLAIPVLQDFSSANWALLVIVAAAMMAVALERGHDVLAGVCWAVVMLKPQVGLIFAVPLLMRLRIRTFAVAVATCVAVSMLPAMLTHTSPVEMLLRTPGSNSGQFWGCGTMPSFICSLMPKNLAVVVGLVIGVLICIWLTRKVISSTDELLIITPAAICSMCWTYARCYSHVAAWFFFIWLCIALKRSNYSRRYVILGIVALLSMTRLFSGLHCLRVHLNASCLQAMDWIVNYFEPIDTLNSTLDLVLFVCLLAFMFQDGLLKRAQEPCLNALRTRCRTTAQPAGRT